MSNFFQKLISAIVELADSNSHKAKTPKNFKNLTFAEQLERVSAFFSPENIANQNVKYNGELALLVIDVQKRFCDPSSSRYGSKDTQKISERIQSLVPRFRKANIPVYAVYYEWKQSSTTIDFYKFRPESKDIVISKNRDSAFAGSKINRILKKDKRKLLLTCGFNVSACVMDTVYDAQKKGFEVCVLEDLSGNDLCNGSGWVKRHLNEMQENGIAVAHSRQVLNTLARFGMPTK